MKICKMMATKDVDTEVVTPRPGFPRAKRPAFAKKNEKNTKALTKTKDMKVMMSHEEYQMGSNIYMFLTLMIYL